MRNTSWFTHLAKKTAQLAGRPAAFGFACGAIIAWLVSGPIFGFSDTWQLLINSGTTIATFLMVFLIQNTQNRDTAAMQVKLDELIRVTQGAQKALLDLEELDQDDLDEFHARYEKLATDARGELARGEKDTDTPAA